MLISWWKQRSDWPVPPRPIHWGDAKRGGAVDTILHPGLRLPSVLVPRIRLTMAVRQSYNSVFAFIILLSIFFYPLHSSVSPLWAAGSWSCPECRSFRPCAPSRCWRPWPRCPACPTCLPSGFPSSGIWRWPPGATAGRGWGTAWQCVTWYASPSASWAREGPRIFWSSLC